ncbi:MAG: response regulator [Pseudomonadota bacterium]|nr:response regulator [Pseudomonadota bacterium]
MSSVGQASVGQAKVLVVDDDERTRDGLARLLEDTNRQVLTAASGTEALRLCLQNEFAVILLDVRMPGISGHETAATIHARPRSAGTPIIFLTGETPDLARLRSYAVGAVDFLTKPIEPYVIQAKVRVFVDLWQKRQQIEQTERVLREWESSRARQQADEAAAEARRQSDGELRAVLERQALIFRAVPVALFTRAQHDAGEITWASDSVSNVLGYPSAAFLEDGELWRSRLHPEDRAAALRALQEADQHEATSCTYRWRVADGTWRWILEHVTRAQEPGAHHLHGTWVDIHEQKRMEAALRQANEALDRRVAERTAELAAALEELESFSYSVSHDLRSPLRSIHAYGRILAEESAPLSESGQHAQTRLNAAVTRMSQLIDDLLRLSRVTRARLERQPVDITALAHEIGTVLRERNPTHVVELVVAPDLVVEGDRGLVQIVLENLLGNAWKFTGPVNPARIEVGARAEDRSVLFVRDNGVGFDMTYATQLFRPFHRLHPMDQFEGTGIGLATVRRIIQRHGGEVWPDSTLGEGATFYFTMAPQLGGAGFRP